MRIEYRKKYPYFGKYKIKINVYNKDWSSFETKTKTKNVLDYLTSNFPSDFKWSYSWCVYLKDEALLNKIIKEFPEHICSAYKPAIGYEDLEGVEKKQERVLWYDKYPYKIILKDVTYKNNHEYGLWCEIHLKGNYKLSTGTKKTSFYFMNSFDAMAFKLAFGDNVVKTITADSKKAKKLLKERANNARNEYLEYMEGENETEK